jgi:hypothetical protein
MVTVVTDELVAWLREQLDEDERVAQGTGVLGWLTYRNPDGSMRYTLAASQAEDGTWIVDGREADTYASAVVVYDWRQVLREVEAKRRIIDAHPIEYSKVSDYTDCANCIDEDSEYDSYPCLTLRLLALPYADRSGYREEWRP